MSCAGEKPIRRLVIWLGALIVGIVLGALGIGAIDAVTGFIANVYTRVFQFLAVPTIALAITTTLASFGSQGGTALLFRRTVIYTLLTTLAAALLSMGLYILINPGTITGGSAEPISGELAEELAEVEGLSYYDHFLTVIPNNIIRPLMEGNVLSVLLIAAAVGIALAKLPESESKTVVVKGLQGVQDILYMVIHGVIWALPVGIVAFAAQLVSELSAGVALESVGRYAAVILGGNLLQVFIILPLFLLCRGINPVRTFSRMLPAVMMALFTKSSAATLPVTISTAEERLGVPPRIARFVLPICTTINMNGCAAFVLVTSLFVMQNGGIELTIPLMLLWVLLSVISAVGNAGVPMGCYFLTLSLVSGLGVPLTVMGIILPIYTVLDMVETAENVWSDSCVCAMVSKNEPEK